MPLVASPDVPALMETPRDLLYYLASGNNMSAEIQNITHRISASCMCLDSILKCRFGRVNTHSVIALEPGRQHPGADFTEILGVGCISTYFIPLKKGTYSIRARQRGDLFALQDIFHALHDSPESPLSIDFARMQFQMLLDETDPLGLPDYEIRGRTAYLEPLRITHCLELEEPQIPFGFVSINYSLDIPL